MQCTSYYRDPYEHAAWQLYLKECSLRAAREEVAFLEATGGATAEELVHIRGRVLGTNDVKMEDFEALANNNTHLLNILNHTSASDQYNTSKASSVTISLKSVLTDVVQSDAINQLCRRVRPMLEQNGIVTFKKHQAIHILKADAQRVRDLGAGLM
jgi:hypothetical protein